MEPLHDTIEQETETNDRNGDQDQETELSFNSVLEQIKEAKAIREAQVARTKERFNKVHDLANVENELFEVRQQLAEAGISSLADEKIQTFVEDREAKIDQWRADPLIQEDFDLHDQERDYFIGTEQQKAGRAMSDGIRSRQNVVDTMVREVLQLHPVKQAATLKDNAKRLAAMVGPASRVGRFRMYDAMPWAKEKTGRSYKWAIEENYNPELELADRLLKAVAKEFYQDKQKNLRTKKNKNR